MSAELACEITKNGRMAKYELVRISPRSQESSLGRLEFLFRATCRNHCSVLPRAKFTPL